MPASKKFCGKAAKLPEGYTGRASRFDCLKKGFGACLASGAAGSRRAEARRSPSKKRERVYCGNDMMLPDGYDRYGDGYECLKKGFGACLYHGKEQPAMKKAASPSRRPRSGKSPARRRGSPRSSTRSLGS